MSHFQNGDRRCQ